MTANGITKESSLRCEHDDPQHIFTTNCPLSVLVESSATAHFDLHDDNVNSLIDHESLHTEVVNSFFDYDVSNRRLYDDLNNQDDDRHFSTFRANRDQADIRRADRRERERKNASAGAQREQRPRRPGWPTQWRAARRRRTVARTGLVDPVDQRAATRRSALPFGSTLSRQHHRVDRSRTLPTAALLDQLHRRRSMATQSSAVGRFASGPLHGGALALYFVLLPYVISTRWTLAAHQTNGQVIRGLLCVLGLFWILFVLQLLRNVVLVRRGEEPTHGGSAWLAGLIVTVLSFLALSHAPVTTKTPVPVTVTASVRTHAPAPGGLPISALPTVGALPFALVAKRRSDELRYSNLVTTDEEIDNDIALLRGANAPLLSRLRTLKGAARDGVLAAKSDLAEVEACESREPLVACVVGHDGATTFISFASEGGRLRIPLHWSSDKLVSELVTIHRSGRLMCSSQVDELVRALATRSLNSTLVLYLGDPIDLDDALRACCVTIERVEHEAMLANLIREPSDSPANAVRGEIRVELLRAEPSVQGLIEPFLPTLRRRCVEMVAYLSLHRHEPITGERLRTRVLARGDVDASSRTLANTASSVRRSLGIDVNGPRLQPVTSSGLYQTHGVTSDVEIFHALVTRARQVPEAQRGLLLEEALGLVRGEPLASVLRGFEWFLAEGHSARLQRDGEWASLALYHDCLERDDSERAFWALERGRLLDPYSDELVQALARVPRLREFGGNRSR